MSGTKMKSETQLNPVKLDMGVRKYGASLVLLALIVANSFVTPNFAHMNNLWNILIQVTPILLVAFGQTFVIASGGIDISIGSVMAIAAMVVSKLLFSGAGVFLSVVVALISAAACGLFSGYIINRFRVEPIIVTLTMMIAGRGIAQVINDGAIIQVSNEHFTFWGSYRIWNVVPIQISILVLVAVLVFFIFKNTNFGLYIQAVGSNYEASRLSGVSLLLTVVSVYTISSVLAGLAGILEAAKLASADANNLGRAIELDAIAAVAIGGTSLRGGRAMIMGTIVGALMMQIITVMVNMNNIPYAYSLVIKSIVLIVALYLQKEKID